MSRSRPRRRFVASLSGIALLIVGAASGPPLRAQTTLIASVASDGTKGNMDSIDPAISPDGRYVAFASHATNLDPLDTRNALDVYWRDLETGTTMVVSKSTGGALGNHLSFHPGISRDGTFVVYMSEANNLVAGDTNRASDIFLFEVATATTTRVSVDSGGGQANKMSLEPVISADGAKIAYTSQATNLVGNDSNGFTDVFLYDVATGTTERISVDSSGSQANGDSDSPALSADGNRVVFASRANNLVTHDANGQGDVFLRDLAAGTTLRVSVGDQGQEPDNASIDPGISGDGSVVGFRSGADNLVPGDLNQKSDAFVNDLAGGDQTNIVGVPAIVSGDGRTFLFGSPSDLAEEGDANGFADVFAHERAPTFASSSHYGSGFPGELGIPALSLGGDPVIGQPLDVTVGSSSSRWILGFLVVGVTPIQLHGAWGGDLLVAPLQLIPVPVIPSGYTFHVQIPYDAALWNFALELQAFELDPGAEKGISSTDGLELDFGN